MSKLSDYPFHQEPGITLYCGDCREVLPLLDEPVRAVITDPPYGIKGGVFWRQNGDSLENWDAAGANAAVEGWMPFAVQVLSPAAFFVEFCSMQIHHLESVIARHRSSGLEVWTRFMIVKSSPPPTVRPIFASGYEEAVVSRRGQPQWHGGGYTPNRWIGQTPNGSRDGLGHPTEKPQEPVQALVRALTGPGEAAIDPFCGSGTLLEACKAEGRRAIGIEIEPKYCEIAVKRLRQEVLPL